MPKTVRQLGSEVEAQVGDEVVGALLVLGADVARRGRRADLLGSIPLIGIFLALGANAMDGPPSGPGRVLVVLRATVVEVYEVRRRRWIVAGEWMLGRCIRSTPMASVRCLTAVDMGEARIDLGGWTLVYASWFEREVRSLLRGLGAEIQPMT